jgi:hypothetical protein
MINGKLVPKNKLPPIATSKPVEKTVEPKLDDPKDPSDFDKFTVAELQEQLSKLEIHFPKSAKKGDLIDLLEANAEDENEPEL